MFLATMLMVYSFFAVVKGLWKAYPDLWVIAFRSHELRILPSTIQDVSTECHESFSFGSCVSKLVMFRLLTWGGHHLGFRVSSLEGEMPRISGQSVRTAGILPKYWISIGKKLRIFVNTSMLMLLTNDTQHITHSYPHSTWKLVVGRWIWDGLSSGAMLVSGSVDHNSARQFRPTLGSFLASLRRKADWRLSHKLSTLGHLRQCSAILSGPIVVRWGM